MLTTAAAATLLALSTAVPLEEPAPQVEVVTVNGSGCPQGTAETSSSGRTFSVSYRQFFAQAGGGAGPTDFRKNCQINIRVSVPPGYTYGLARNAYNGFAHLQSGASALHRVSFYFQGSSETTIVNFPFTGPFTDEWRSVYRPNPADIVYAPCGVSRNLNINSELRVNAGTSDRRSFILTEASRGTIRAKRC